MYPYTYININISISNRLSTVQNADLIFVLERGRMVEKGTHTELLVKGGRYAELVSKMTSNNSSASATTGESSST